MNVGMQRSIACLHSFHATQAGLAVVDPKGGVAELQLRLQVLQQQQQQQQQHRQEPNVGSEAAATPNGSWFSGRPVSVMALVMQVCTIDLMYLVFGSVGHACFVLSIYCIQLLMALVV